MRHQGLLFEHPCTKKSDLINSVSTEIGYLISPTRSLFSVLCVSFFVCLSFCVLHFCQSVSNISQEIINGLRLNVMEGTAQSGML